MGQDGQRPRESASEAPGGALECHGGPEPAHLSARDRLHATVQDDLEALAAMDRPAMVALWLKLHGNPLSFPANHKFLRQLLAYRIRELAYGGLSEKTRKRLAEIAREEELERLGLKRQRRHVRPGTRLVRVWEGKSHTAEVTEDGFLYQNKKYRSLSVIAREITGTQWSGPAFFGLKTLKTRKAGNGRSAD